MSSEWPVVRLGDYCLKIGSGATPRGGKNVYLELGDTALIRSQNIYNEGFKDEGVVYITQAAADKLSNVEVQEKDILINITGDSVARTCLAPSEYLPARVNQHVAIIRPDPEEFDARFLRYFLVSPTQQELLLTIASAGATRNALTKGHLESLEVCKPRLKEQKAIAWQLEKLDNKIQLNNQINQTLEQMAQAIFKSWFVDFEPVKAKIAALEAGGSEDDALLAAMQAIAGSALFATDAADADAQTQLARLQAEHPEQYATLRATAELFPSAMQESELGEIPEGWEAKPFGELLIKTIGGDWGKDEPDEKHTEKVKILRGTDLPHVYAGYDDKVPTRYVDPKKLATRKLENGDIVIEVSGGSPTQPTGRSLYLTQEIINRLNADLEPASFCRLFRPESKETGLILGLHLQKIYGEGKTWLYQNTSTGISNFQTKMFLEKELLVIPPNEIQQYFFEMVMPYLQKMSNGENKILAELRDTLLPKLLSGELSVSAATDQITQAEEAIDV